MLNQAGGGECATSKLESINGSAAGEGAVIGDVSSLRALVASAPAFIASGHVCIVPPDVGSRTKFIDFVGSFEAFRSVVGFA